MTEARLDWEEKVKELALEMADGKASYIMRGEEIDYQRSRDAEEKLNALLLVNPNEYK